MRPSSATAASRESGFGARVREARETAGLSQRELAEAIGLSKDAVSQWERAVSGVSWENLRQLAQVLDCSEDWLRLGERLDGFPARDGHDSAGDLTRFIAEMDRELARRGHVVSAPEAGAGGFLVGLLVDLQERVAQIEAALTAHSDVVGDEVVGASRQVKRALTEGLDDQDDESATPAEPDTPHEDDATSESA